MLKTRLYLESLDGRIVPDATLATLTTNVRSSPRIVDSGKVVYS